MSRSLQEIAERIGAELDGDPHAQIDSLGGLESARAGQVAHLSSRHYVQYLEATEATAVILSPAYAGHCKVHKLILKNPSLGYAHASQLFDRRPRPKKGVDATASVSENASLGSDVRIGPLVSIGSKAKIGDRVEVGPGTVIHDGVEIGEDSSVRANVVIYHDVVVGARCVIHGGAVIGADGFGFSQDEKGRHHPIAQLGSVRMGDDVVVGACTCIDRGAIEDTVIGNGVKLDNLVQVAHNCKIGDHALMCGCAGIAGSTTLGAHSVLAGGVGVAGDGPLTIAPGVVVTAMSFVSRSIKEPGVYSATLLHNRNSKWRRNALRFQELDEMADRVARLESMTKTDTNSGKPHPREA